MKNSAKQLTTRPDVGGAGPAPAGAKPARDKRHIELLKLSNPLHGYAGTLRSDPNASYFLVHAAMIRAFAEADGELRPSEGLEASLRADMDVAAKGVQAQA